MDDNRRTPRQLLGLWLGLAGCLAVVGFVGHVAVVKVVSGLGSVVGNGDPVAWGSAVLAAGGTATVLGLGAGLLGAVLSGARALRASGGSDVVAEAGSADAWSPGDVRRWVAGESPVTAVKDA